MIPNCDFILERGQIVTTIKLEHKLFTGLASSNNRYPIDNRYPAPPQVVQNGQVQPLEPQENYPPIQTPEQVYEPLENQNDHPQRSTKNPYYTPRTTRTPIKRPIQHQAPVTNAPVTYSPVTHAPVTQRTYYKQTTKSHTTVIKNGACGKQKIRANPLVYNGKPSTRGDWPWLVAYYTNEKENPIFICGGTLISEVNFKKHHNRIDPQLTMI